MAEVRDLIAKGFAEFLHQEGARQRPHDFADGLLIALGRGGYVVVPDDDDDQHEASCRICGCTENAACGGGCRWASDEEQLAAGLEPMDGDLCSACLPVMKGGGGHG